MLRCCVDVETPIVCMGNEVATAKEYSMTKKCVIDVNTSPVKLKF